MFKIYIVLFVTFSHLFFSYLLAQPIPSNRITDWSGAGAVISINDTLVNILNFSGDSSGVNDNSFAMVNALAALPNGGTVYFPKGTYLFKLTQNIPSGIRIKGEGAEHTIFNFDKGGTGDCINVSGSKSNSLDTILGNYIKDSTLLLVKHASIYSKGEFIKIVEDDNGRIYSTWASNSIGQIVKIVDIDTLANTLKIDQPLRQTYSAFLYPRISKIFPKENISFECFTLKRLDVTTAQTSNFNFNNTANCQIQGVKSYDGNFAHVVIQSSTNLTISESFFKDAHAYGGGGQGYGVAIQATSGYNLIENNQFVHLRHSILLQYSANGNVIGYNYSRDPYWTGVLLPSNSAGDMVLHGNYVYMNLFEGNICQNIVIDNSHGINGPFNTFFRNRAELYGIFMNTSPASDSQNFVANEITSSTMGFYSLAGNNHFEYGNNHVGTIKPSGTDTLQYKSYYLHETPIFWNGYYKWPSVGLGNPFNKGTIPSKENYNNTQFSLCYEDSLQYSFLLCPNQILSFNNKNYQNQGVFLDSIDYYRGKKRYLNIAISLIPKPTVTNLGGYLEADLGIDYQWYLNGAILIGETNRTHTYTQNGWYNVLLTESYGCVQFSDSVYVGNASIDESLNAEDIKIYPNPARHYIEIIQKEVIFDHLSLYNNQGKKLISLDNIAEQHKLNLQDLAKGVYILKFNNSTTFCHKKLIIE